MHPAHRSHDLTQWQQTTLAKALRPRHPTLEAPRAPAEATPLPPETLLPPGEEMAPASPTEAITQYIRLLEWWGDLSARQRTYEAALATLHATGTQLATEWDRLVAEHTACLAALAQCPLAPDALVREAWAVFKARLGVLATPAQVQRYSMSPELQAFLAAMDLHPRGHVPTPSSEGEDAHG